VASVRRRLKVASIIFDRVMLEGGSAYITAGPRAAISTNIPFGRGPLRRHFDTTRARGAAKGQPFSIAMGPEAVPGVPSEGPYQVVAASEASMAWDASLEPFVPELPRTCTWMGFPAIGDVPDELEKQCREWVRRDEKNAALVTAVPVDFLRSRIIQHANNDLARGIAIRAAVSVDSLHQRVTVQRYADEKGWKFVGFALPVLFPQVTDLSWDEVAELRQHKAVEAFRRTLEEVEADALAAGMDDLEATVHQLYEGKLAKAVGEIEGLGAVVKRTTMGLVIGGGAGFMTAGITGPVGTAAGAVVGAVAGGVMDYRAVRGKRRQRGWVALDTQLRS
jgi:hypothetical protein